MGVGVVSAVAAIVQDGADAPSLSTSALSAVRPVDVSVWKWRGGDTVAGTVRSPLPLPFRGQIFFSPAPQMPHADQAREAALAAVSRCAPWCTVYVGPRLWSFADPEEDLSAFRDMHRLRDGRVVHGLGGQAWIRGRSLAAPDTILLAAWASPRALLATMHHELWHVLEKYLSNEAASVIDAAVAAGSPAPGGYLDSIVERRARLYQHWASAMDEEYSVLGSGTPFRLLDAVFWHAYSGGLARELAARDCEDERPPRRTVARFLSLNLWMWRKAR